MYKFLTKHGTGVAFGLGLLVTLIGLAIVFAGIDGFNALPEDQQGTTSIFNVSLYLTFVLLVVAVVAVLVFGVMQLVSHPKNAIKFGIALAVIVILGFLFYSLSSVETSGKIYDKIQAGELSAGMSKILTGALWTTLVLAVLAVLGIVVSEIRNLFK